jgi:hypothetical protein
MLLSTQFSSDRGAAYGHRDGNQHPRSTRMEKRTPMQYTSFPNMPFVYVVSLDVRLVVLRVQILYCSEANRYLSSVRSVHGLCQVSNNNNNNAEVCPVLRTEFNTWKASQITLFAFWPHLSKQELPGDGVGQRPLYHRGQSVRIAYLLQSSLSVCIHEASFMSFLGLLDALKPCGNYICHLL